MRRENLKIAACSRASTFEQLEIAQVGQVQMMVLAAAADGQPEALVHFQRGEEPKGKEVVRLVGRGLAIGTLLALEVERGRGREVRIPPGSGGRGVHRPAVDVRRQAKNVGHLGTQVQVF